MQGRKCWGNSLLLKSLEEVLPRCREASLYRSGPVAPEDEDRKQVCHCFGPLNVSVQRESPGGTTFRRQSMFSFCSECEGGLACSIEDGPRVEFCSSQRSQRSPFLGTGCHWTCPGVRPAAVTPRCLHCPSLLAGCKHVFIAVAPFKGLHVL